MHLARYPNQSLPTDSAEEPEKHVKQAVDYASNQGTEWVALTNGMVWRVYKVIFGKPIERELVVDLDLSKLNARSPNDVALLGFLV